MSTAPPPMSREIICHPDRSSHAVDVERRDLQSSRAAAENPGLPNALLSAESTISAEHRGRTGFAQSILTFPTTVAAAYAVFVYLLVPHSIADPDIWWHLRNAATQLQSHSLLYRDLYSWTTPNAPWMNHEWLAELPFYLGWRIAGAAGIYAVTTAAIEVIFLGVYSLAYRKSHSTMAALAVSAVAAMLATVSFGPRTLLFGWICLVAELLIFEHIRSRPALAWLLPPLFAIWVNTHGSWLIGIVVLVLCIAAGWPGIHSGAIQNEPWSPHQRKNLLTTAALSISALFLNPYGWRLVAYPFDLAFRQKLNIANIEEWRTLDFHTPRGRILFVTLAVLFLLQLVRRRTWTLTDLAFLTLGIYAALVYSRFLFLAAILALPLMAPSFINPPLAPPSPHNPKPNKPYANALMLVMLIPLILRRLPTRAELDGSGAQQFPVQAAAWLRKLHPQGNVFNDFLWGGFLIWNAPQVPVFIDSRVDIYEYAGVFQDYLDAVRLKDSLAILDKYHIRYVILSKDAPLVYLLEHTAGWKADYEDATAAILERSPAASPVPAAPTFGALRGRPRSRTVSPPHP